MKKQPKKQNSRSIKFKNFGWLLWIVVLIFVQVTYGTTLTKKETLTDEERKSFTGLYLEVHDNYVGTKEITADENHKIEVGISQFDPEKHKDEETLKTLTQIQKKLSSSIDAKYYLKDETSRKLVVMSDGSLQLFSKYELLSQVFYKIENITEEKTINQIRTTKYNTVATIKQRFRNNNFENFAEEVDTFLGEHFRRISILKEKPKLNKNHDILYSSDTPSVTENIKQTLPIITCCIVLIIVMTFLCIQCCQSQNEVNTEHLRIQQHETNDLSNHYPSSTDLIIDVKDTGSTQSIQPNIKPSNSISIVLSGNMKTNSSNLFSIESIALEEVNESKNAQSTETNSNQSFSMTTVTSTDIEKNKPELSASESTDLEVKKPKTVVSESKQNPESTNDTTTQDEFTI